MSHSWVRKLFRKAFETSPRRLGAAVRAKKTRLHLENLESRLTPSGSPPVASAIPRQLVNENSSAVVLDLSTYFTDPELDPLTYSVVQTNTTGLVTPTVDGSNLTLAFAAGQYGYSYLRVTANDGTGSTTQPFEVIVRNTDTLVNDTAAAAKSSASNINVLGNDGANDNIRHNEAGNMNVVQNDTGNTNTSVTLSFPTGTPDMFVDQATTNRGDYTVRVGTSFSDDVATGALLTTVNQNGRDNGEGTGVNVVTSMIDQNATQLYYFIPTANSAAGSEYNVNVAVGYFPYADGWLGGWGANVSGANGGANDIFKTSTPNAGFTIGTAAANVFQDQGSGQSRIKIQGVSSLTDGVLISVSAKNEDNYSMASPNPDGSWQIINRDNGTSGTSFSANNEQDPVAFIYVPKDMPNVVSGRIMGDGSVQLGSGDYMVTKTGTGTYELSIPGQSPTSGVLMLSPEGGQTATADNFTTYEASGNNFVIKNWDIVATAAPVAEDVGGSSARVASFVFIPFLNTPTLRTFSVQSTTSTPNVSDKGATLSINPDGTVHYDPSTSVDAQALLPGESIVDTFTYTTRTMTGQLTTATVSVTVIFEPSYTVDLDASGVLTINSTPNVAGTMTVGFDGSNYTFADSVPYYLTPAAQAAFSGTGTTSITGLSTAVNQIVIKMGDLTDTVTVNALNDPFTIIGGGEAGDTVNIAATLTFTGDASITGVSTISAATGAKLVTTAGSVTLSASDAVGTSTNPILTQAATLSLAGGAGGIFLTEDDGATLTATASAGGSISITNTAGTLSATATAADAGNISLTNLDGTLNIAGTTSVSSGTLTLSSGDAITLNGNLLSGSITPVVAGGAITITANTDNGGSEGYNQGSATIITTNTGTAALSITVGGSGDAAIGAGTIGSNVGGAVNVTAGGNILWSSFYVIPDIGTANGAVLRANAYTFNATGPASSIGTLAAPIQSDNFADFSPAALTAGSGGIYWTDWGATDMTFTNVVAQGAGNIQLIAANASGHNLSVYNVTTGSGNITMIADDDLFVGNLNNLAGDPIPGFIGDANFTGTISMLANRDTGNEQRILMRPGSIIRTNNTTANAILMRTFATDNSPTAVAIGGVTVTSVIAGDGGTITVDTASLPSSTGNIIQQDDTTVGFDAGPLGTVSLRARNILNGAVPAVGAAIGDAISPLRIRAGHISAISENSPIRIAATIDSSITATVAAVGVATLPGATVVLSTETGILTIGGATHSDGGPITATGAAGVVVNGVLGDDNTGNMIVTATAGDIVFNSNLTVYPGQTVTLAEGNAAQLGPVTTVNGNLIAANGVSLSTGQVLGGDGSITGAITATTGAAIAPGNSTGIMTTNGAVTLGGNFNVEINGTTVGTGYDQLDVSASAVDLTGATLKVDLGYSPTVAGDTFTIIKNYSSLTGAFSNTFPLSVESVIFTINYAGGPTNNDVVLTIVNVRPSAVFAPVVPSPRNNSLTSETITFSEPVTGFDITDLTLTLDGNNVPLTGVTISGTGPAYSIDGLGALTGTIGTYVLTLNTAGSGIEDLNVPAGTLFGDAVVSWVVSDNLAPVLDSQGNFKLTDILQGDTANTGTLIADLILSDGIRITDPDLDPLGIAITTIDSTNGTWEYSTNNGSSWSPVGTVSATSARLLAADATTRIRFVPNANFIGKVATGITFRAWDQTTGANGGLADVSSNGSSTSFSSSFDTASVYAMYVPKALTVNFAQGLNGYTGTQDTELGEVAPFSTDFGTTDPVGGLLVDYHTSGEMAQVLLRFDQIFGDGPGQIPLGSTIVSAHLTLTTNNTGAVGAFHRMKTTWDQAVDTWNTFGDNQAGHNATNGVQADGLEANANYYSFGGPPGVDQASGQGLTQFGVTPDLQAWSNGEANNGWAMLPWVGGTDGWAFHSSEAIEETDRPVLSVKFLPPGSSVSVANMKQGVGGYTGTVDTELRQNQPDANRDLAAESFVDFDDDSGNQTEALLRFNNLLGNSPVAIPAGANVVASSLVLASTSNASPGDGGTFNRMVVDWNGADTWNTFANGTGGRNATGGIQTDGSEALSTWNFQAGTALRSPLAQATIFPFNATTDVQAWVSGTANYGWVGFPWVTGENGWSFNQSEIESGIIGAGRSEAIRPGLVTYYVQAEHEHGQLDVANRALSFIAGGGASGTGVANNLSVSLASGVYTITDTSDVIVLTAGAISAGWSGSGTNTVTGPSSEIDSLALTTGLATDIVTLHGAGDPISVNGGNTGSDILNLDGTISAAGGTVNLYGFSALNQVSGVVGGGTVYLSAKNIGSAGSRFMTAAGTLYVQDVTGSAFITDADAVTIGQAVLSGAGSLDVATATGALTVGGYIRSDSGAITLTGASDLLVNANIGDTFASTTTGAFTFAAQTGNYIQSATASLVTGNGTATAVSITAAGDATLSGGNVGGTVVVNADNLLWGGVVDVGNNPVGGTEPVTLIGHDYLFTATAPGGSIGTLATPIQTNASSNASIALLVAGSGGVYLTDWGGADMSIASATATGAGNIQLFAATGGGSNLEVTNVHTETGNIFISVDDTLTVEGVIGGPGFSGTVSLLANRDNAGEQRITMNVGSSIVTTNNTAAAVALTVFATDTNPADATNGGVTLTQITVGDGGTITINASADGTKQGNIIQQDNTTTLDAGAAGTVVLYAENLQDGANPAGGAFIGDTIPIRVHAGTINITAVNTSVNVASTTSTNFNASVTAAGALTVLPGQSLTLAAETGTLTIASPASAPGGVISLTGPSIVLNAQLGNGTDGTISINGNFSGSGAIAAGTGAVTLTQPGASTYAGVISGGATVVKVGAGALSLTAANLYTGGTTINAGTLLFNNTTGSGAGTGDVTVNGGTLGGTGAISGNVIVTAGTLAPGTSPGTITIGGNLDLSSAVHYHAELAAPASFDQAVVGGNANLNTDGNVAGGATLDLTVANGAVLSGTNYTILTGAAVTGTFRNHDGNELTDGESFVSAGDVAFTIDYTATSVILTVNAPTITSVLPISGPTTGGTLVTITGTNFGGVTGAAGVQFGLGANAASYIVTSNTTITATTAAHAAGTVDVIVTNNFQVSTTALPANNDFTFVAGSVAPTFDDLVVNGGAMYVVDAFGNTPTGLSGHNSIIEQLLVKFDVGVTLGAGAFTIDAALVDTSFSSGVTQPATPNLDVVGIIVEPQGAPEANGGFKNFRLRFTSNAGFGSSYFRSQDNTGSGGTLSTTLIDGFYYLNVNGAAVHEGATVAGTPMASNEHVGFWTLFGSDDPSSNVVSPTLGDGASFISVSNADLSNFANTYTRDSSDPLYKVNYDFDLDGFISNLDLSEFALRYTNGWVF